MEAAGRARKGAGWLLLLFLIPLSLCCGPLSTIWRSPSSPGSLSSTGSSFSIIVTAFSRSSHTWAAREVTRTEGIPHDRLGSSHHVHLLLPPRDGDRVRRGPVARGNLKALEEWGLAGRQVRHRHHVVPARRGHLHRLHVRGGPGACIRGRRAWAFSPCPIRCSSTPLRSSCCRSSGPCARQTATSRRRISSKARREARPSRSSWPSPESWRQCPISPCRCSALPCRLPRWGSILRSHSLSRFSSLPPTRTRAACARLLSLRWSRTR